MRCHGPEAKFPAQPRETSEMGKWEAQPRWTEAAPRIQKTKGFEERLSYSARGQPWSNIICRIRFGDSLIAFGGVSLNIHVNFFWRCFLSRCISCWTVFDSSVGHGIMADNAIRAVAIAREVIRRQAQHGNCGSFCQSAWLCTWFYANQNTKEESIDWGGMRKIWKSIRSLPSVKWIAHAWILQAI